jgi:anti-sigma regulatory factor (Ser/Thr protein kinase)
MPMGRGVTLTFRCRPDTVPRARGMVDAELRHNGINGDTAERMVLASAEACNNAILHSACASYVVRVEIEGAVCTVTVSDDGIGFEVPDRIEMPAPEAVSRRGLALMRTLVDDVEVSSGPSGTTVVLRQALDRALRPVALT